MWWITTTPPNESSPSGRARYASISSPSCPAMLMVCAISASVMRSPRVVGQCSDRLNPASRSCAARPTPRPRSPRPRCPRGVLRASTSRPAFLLVTPVALRHHREGGRPGRGADMGSAAVGIAAIVLVVGCFLGWHAHRASAAHGDLKTTHNRISGYRKTRLRTGLIILGLLALRLLIV